MPIYILVIFIVILTLPNCSYPLTVGAVDVVVAGGQRVGLASGVVAEQVTGNGSLGLEPSPGALGVSSVAALAAGEAAAGQQVLGGDAGLQSLVAGNADSVREGLDGGDGPAAAAARLVSDLLQGLAVGPGGTGVEAGGDVVAGGDVLQGESVVLGGLEGAELLLDVVHGHVGEALVHAGLPGGVGPVDLGDDVLGHGGEEVGAGHRRD